MVKKMTHVSLRLDGPDYAHLKKSAAAHGMKMEPYIRHLIRSKKVIPKTYEGWPDLMRQVSAIGNNVNQIARVANTNRHIEPEAIENLTRLLQEIFQQVLQL